MFNQTISGKNLAALEIQNVSSGVTALWHFCRRLMSNCKRAALVLKDSLPKGIGGMEVSYANCDFVLMEKQNLDGNKLIFKDDRVLASFIHELAHWLHFVYFQGKFGEGNPLKGTKIGSIKVFNSSLTERYYAELEAWLISRRLLKMFRADELTEAVDYVNRKNMSIVAITSKAIPDYTTPVHLGWSLDGNDISEEEYDELDEEDSDRVIELTETPTFEETPYVTYEPEDFILDRFNKVPIKILPDEGVVNADKAEG